MPTASTSPAAVFAAIADPTRRRLLDALRAGPQSVARLAEQFPMSRPAISKHLRVLREAGLVRARTCGRENHYRLNTRPLRQVDRWLAAYRNFWTVNLGRLKRHVERGSR